MDKLYSKIPYPGKSFSSNFKLTMECELCQREMERLTLHHLTPRQYAKRKKVDPGVTVKICSACHKQIHALFDNKRLARELNTLEKLSKEPQMQKFITWIKKQKPRKRIVVRSQNN